ncbi:MAG: hypothetical protein M3179_14220 [Actinomycetota bacterium]|nr:hypothetical protein [Actinomycetota bacterium]
MVQLTLKRARLPGSGFGGHTMRNNGSGRGRRIVMIVGLAAMAMFGLPGLSAPGQAATSTIGSWELTDHLNVVRFGHTTTLMGNGKVLVAGGRSATAAPFTNHASAEVFDPITEEFTLTGFMGNARFSHTATLLPNGKVLVAGGFGDPPSTPNQPVLDTAELYDPATGTWTPTGSLNTRRALHIAVLLNNGKVLVAGGRTCDVPPPGGANCASSFRTPTAELYDPATGVWTPTGSMNFDRHTTAAALLPDGRVIVPGGFTFATPNGSNSADIYDPATGNWSLNCCLNVGRSRQGAMRLQDGRVLIALGFRGPSVPNPTTETFDPVTQSWSFAGDINFPFSRFNFWYGVLPNGKAVVAGGQHFVGPGNEGIVRNSHIFDPTTNQWTDTGSMNEPHGTPGGIQNSQPMVILSASPTSYVADPAVCGRHCGKALVAGDSLTGSSELFTAPNTCFGFNATILGTEGADTIVGTRGRDVIVALGGEDRITASYGNDIICGGEGNDFISGDYNDDVVLAEAGADRVTGGDGNDYAFGESGPDQLAGMAGTDTADGGKFENGGNSCFAEVVRNC